VLMLFILAIIQTLIKWYINFVSKRNLVTGHALFTFRSAVEYYVTNGLTVIVALLDISKAFDRVCHVTML